MFTASCRDFLHAPFWSGLVKGGRTAVPLKHLAALAHARSTPSHIHYASHRQVSELVADASHSQAIDSASLPEFGADSVRDLFKEAQIARLAGYCYDDFATLRENVAAEGLRVISSGDTFFTSWYFCAGPISGNVPGEEIEAKPTDTGVDEDNTLHVFFRGVMWRSPEVQTARVWQKLSQSWGKPVPVSVDLADTQATAPDDTLETNSGLVAHSGILDMAKELYAEMRPHLLQHTGPIRISGHSLGGTLALLVAAQFILAEEIEPTRLQLHAFGSPPALSHTSCPADISSNCGAAVRQRLGLPAAQVRNWVLDFDPVPRATTAANPYLQVARRNEAFRSLYDLAGMAATALGVAHPAQRFFFRHVGNVFMLTHSDPAAESGIRQLPEASADEVLAESPVVGRGEGFRPRAIARELLRSVLDHTHTSYGHDLLVAAQLAQHQHDTVTGSVRGSLAPHRLARDNLQPRSSASGRGNGMHDPSTGSGSLGARELAQWPPRRGAATHARSGDAGNGSIKPPNIVVRQGDAGVDAVGPGAKRSPAGVLALARGRVAGVRIKNGVVWRPYSAAQAPIGSVNKAVLSHRGQDGARVLEVADSVPGKENDALNKQDMLADVIQLPSSSGKTGIRRLDGGAKGSVL